MKSDGHYVLIIFDHVLIIKTNTHKLNLDTTIYGLFLNPIHGPAIFIASKIQYWLLPSCILNFEHFVLIMYVCLYLPAFIWIFEQFQAAIS